MNSDNNLKNNFTYDQDYAAFSKYNFNISQANLPVAMPPDDFDIEPDANTLGDINLNTTLTLLEKYIYGL